MMVLFVILAPVLLAAAVLVVVSAFASVTALGVAVLPVKKVPLTYNLRNLQVRWLTTLVTGLAFTLVVGLLVVMLAFVQGMDDLSNNSGNPNNIIIMSDGATDEAFSSLAATARVEELANEIQQLVARDNDPLRTFIAVKEVYVIVNHFLPRPDANGRTRRFVQMRGVDDWRMAARIHGIELGQGQWFSESGVRKIPTAGGKEKLQVRQAVAALGLVSSGIPSPVIPREVVPLQVAALDVSTLDLGETAYEVVLGHGIAQVFGKDKGVDAVGPGEILRLGQLKWYVVGVMKDNGTMFGSEIWSLDKYVGPNFGRKNTYSSYVMQINDPNDAAKAAALLKKSPQAIAATPEPEYYAKLGETNKQFLVAVIFVAVVMAIGGVLGVMNTMFAAVSQRRKDIGVLRLLGFTRWQILMSFLMESLIIAFIGGALGLAAAYWLADGYTMASVMSSGAGGGKSVVLKLSVTGWIVGAAAAFTFLMGAVGGLIPSLSAMRLRPLESLR
jgi:ABC-type lipoprotein release transport system permease subunit